MINRLCEQCIHRDDCCILNPRECGEYLPLDTYIEDQRYAFYEEFFQYLDSFENN